MMTKNRHNLVILSGDIRTGKTTALSAFANRLPYAQGFITPDTAEGRRLLTLSDRVIHPFETSPDDSQPMVTIGRFHFLQHSFQVAQEAIFPRDRQIAHWIIIDEAGPLELSDKGIEPYLTSCLDEVEKNTQIGIIVVVRSTLVHGFIEKYGHPACNIHTSILTKCEATKGAVLCGGESSRMGTDKALLSYINDTPQYLSVAQLLKNLVPQVLMACGNRSLPEHDAFTLVSDIEPLQGPAAGVLAAFRQSKGHLLVVGCDYPMLHLVDLMRLMAESDDHWVVCYEDESAAFADPLVCFYDQKCYPLMEQWYRDGNRSLRHFIKTVPHKILKPSVANRLKSIDTPELYQMYKPK